VRWVMRHACQPLDHLGHTLQGPHVIRIAVCCRTFEQLMLDMREFVSAQLRSSAGTTCTNQSSSPGPSPRGAPVGHDLMRHTDLPRYLSWNDVLFKQIGCLHTPRLQHCKVTSRPNPAIHRPARLLLYRNTSHPRVSHEPLSIR